MLNANRPPRRSTRATSGTTRCGSANVIAPWSQKTTSKLASGNGSDSAPPCTSGKSTARRRRARARADAPSCRARPARALPREQDRPLRSAAAELEHVLAGHVAEHLELALRDLPDPPAGLRPADELAVALLVLVARRSQKARFRSASDELIVREPERDLARGRLRRVRAVDEVVRHREREVAADRARRGVLRVRGAHRRADDRDRRLALDDERERRRRGDEGDQLAEERLLAMLGVVAARQGAVDRDELRRAQRRARGARAARRSRRPGRARPRPA